MVEKCEAPASVPAGREMELSSADCCEGGISAALLLPYIWVLILLSDYLQALLSPSQGAAE